MRTSSPLLVLALLVASLSVGCASKTPLEQAIESRAAYKATLNSFFVRETPLVEPTPATDEQTGDEDSVDEPAAPAEDSVAVDDEPVAVPVRLDVVLDVIVQHDTRDPLAGVTIDISMVDGEREEVGHWRLWVDTEGLPKANQRTVTHILEGIDYQEGYGFNVEVRHPVPAGEHGNYQELSGLAG